MPLRVAIVGGGLAGLASAIHLARYGHLVHIYERSSFARETGAALQLHPHVVKLLKDAVVDLDRMRPSTCKGWIAVDSSGTRTVWDYDDWSRRTGATEPHISVHRVDAHNVLKDTALAYSNVSLFSSKPVTGVESGTVLCGEEKLTYDLVVGADGLHSKAVQAFGVSPARSLGRYIYRFTVDLSLAQQDPIVARFLESWDIHRFASFTFPPIRVIAYPCRGDSLLNVAIGIPKAANEPSLSGWNHEVDREALLEQLDPPFRQLAGMADDITRFEVMTRDLSATFVRGRLVLVGDAAHSISPMYSAGAGTSFEEAAVLGVLMRGADAEDVPDRLDLYNSLRYPRGAKIKLSSESSGQTVPGVQAERDWDSMWRYLWDHDAVQEAEKALGVRRPASSI